MELLTKWGVASNRIMTKQLCAICGVREAVTKDHVPPRGIFVKPRPSNLIKVPACFTCNNDASDLDEQFRVYLGLHVGGSGGPGEKLFKEEALRTLKHNKNLQRKILRGIEPVNLATPGGIIYDRGYRVRWNSEVHDKVVERTIRGLYFHHYNRILGKQAHVKVQWLRRISAEMAEMVEGWGIYSFGRGEVAYRYGRAEESSLDSVWVFQFYGAHWASGYSWPIERGSNHCLKPAAYVAGAPTAD
jgi:hypothetical protein